MAESEEKIESNEEPEEKSSDKEENTEVEAIEDTNVESLAEAKAEDKQKSEVEQELLYLRAEFENYKKRMNREQEKAIKYSNEKIVSELLFVFDLLERALSHGKTIKGEGSEVKALTEGVELTHRELRQTMNKFGVEFVGEEGEVFNPALHEAISQLEAPDEKVNTILSVVQKGCLLNGRLLKPAKVVVGKAASNSEKKA